MSKKITNLAGFTPQGALGQMFARARALNELNQQLSAYLPEAFKSLSLCTIDNNTATFVTHNQALAFRVQKQPDVLLNALKQVALHTKIEKVIVKIDLHEY
ncbi:hypothetical protein BTHERMOSOX_1469 [Bathymodiolus thermophilus thioautotrophic gill symbiont]|uniref:DUF721 domain-containing protein n=1 Tax=Bathymodiolus thermophilus thioautotrophic gill symbiont TaxID=2360 RepID=A0A3G3IJA3_9GAMM|nr:hypothetical protein [Bathymodiolus thermophilus thioautotrophic gill symbiont]AYQ55788.1 hypothetical protein MS2017_0018 [Bathymodiolus thermophilus thioautotrophic gill symbiont]CAB5499983.1 hypothetical protein THERMOT_1153 [Bathymodiolus thermophilus thioautotrophic gill symbiont]SHA11203.1 hypothetical protein BTHERMOSOX_1469 [Bathymodiolus thermophilus thioautotrophic gill symbiont]